MKNNYILEGLASVLIIILALALTDMVEFWMPSMVHMMILATLIAVFAIFAVFIWHEKPRDEREVVQRGRAGRLGFLVGAAVLTIGIVFQSYYHTLDPWLVYALTTMILSKLLAVAYGRFKL